jgi:tetratricopeptide (TPR) repeat protein
MMKRIKHQEARKEAEELKENGDHEKAIEKYWEASNLAKSDEDKNYYRSKALTQEAVKAEKQGNYQEAKSKLNLAANIVRDLELPEELNKIKEILDDLNKS